MGVDDLGRPPGVLGGDLRGDEHRGVAERPGVEDRGHLADDALVDQLLDAGDRLLFAGPGAGRDLGVGPAGDRERALHQVEQALVEIVERDRRSVLSAAELGRGLAARWASSLAFAGRARVIRLRRGGGGLSYRSHRAASLAW